MIPPTSRVHPNKWRQPIFASTSDCSEDEGTRGTDSETHDSSVSACSDTLTMKSSCSSLNTSQDLLLDPDASIRNLFVKLSACNTSAECLKAARADGSPRLSPRRYHTTEVNLHNWLKKHGMKLSKDRSAAYGPNVLRSASAQLPHQLENAMFQTSGRDPAGLTTDISFG